MKIRTNVAVSDSGFIFDPETGESFTLNSTGLLLFRYLKEGKSPDEIMKLVTAEYDIDPLSFEKYFQDFREMLKQFNLMTYE